MAIAAHFVYELDANGKQLRVVKYSDYAADRVRTLYTTAAELRSHWSNAEERDAILSSLEEQGVSLGHLAEHVGQPDADPFDLLCYVAYNAPIRTRRERAERLRKGQRDFWERFRPEARTRTRILLPFGFGGSSTSRYSRFSGPPKSLI